MILNLTTVPTERELTLFMTMLSDDDVVLLTEDASLLAFQFNPFSATGCVLAQDINRLGANIDPSWQPLSDADWLNLITTHDKQVTW